MSLIEKKHPDPERASIRRKQVLDAAEGCFRRSGFHGASMAEISKAAGMSAGHIYNYFDGKEAIIAAFVQQNLDRVTALVHDLAQHEDPLQATLDDVERSVHESLDNLSWKMPLEVFAEAARNPKIAAMLQESDHLARSSFARILMRARERRGLSGDVAEFNGRLEAIISMYQGLQVRLLHNPTLDEAAVSAAFRMALRPLLFS